MNLYKTNTITELANAHINLMICAFAFGLAIASRALFQGIPSVDPLLPIIFLTASRLSPWKAATFGGTTYFASNSIVWGGHGWWDVPMVIGAALVGLCGYYIKNHRYCGIIIGTALYEIIVNGAWAILFGWSSLIMAAPFVATHMFSNIGFMGVGNTVLNKLSHHEPANQLLGASHTVTETHTPHASQTTSENQLPIAKKGDLNERKN